ncbi:MAG: hypothetical protein ACRCVT_09655 [Leadbetterella sp.]
MKKNLIIFMLFMFASVLGSAQESNSTLGLIERRALKKFQENRYPNLLKELNTAAGYTVTVEVKWESICRPGQSELYDHDDYWVRVYFTTLKKAFEQITVDAEGKKQLSSKLKKVIIHYDASTEFSGTYKDGLAWDNGVFTMNLPPYTNVTDPQVDDRANKIQLFIESRL